MIIQKMNRKGFTLVELIVVITILAILATIAFLSFQGYSATARDSKRKSDLRSMVSTISIQQTSGMSLLGLVGDSSYNLATLPNVAGAISTGTDYQAGKPNYVALNINATNFKDPYGSDYALGASTRAGGTFQLAATLEGDSAKVGYIVGTFNPRKMSTVGSSTAASGATSITLTSQIGFFKKNDVIKGTGITAGTTITKVGGDGATLTLSAPTTAINAAPALNADDADGFIKPIAGTVVVTDSGSTLPYSF